MPNGISLQEYHQFGDFLRESTGIQLGDNKQYLVTSRLAHLLREDHLQSISELLTQIRGVNGRVLMQHVIDAMTTNETNWFRDTYPFPIVFNKLLPEVNPQGPAKIWCAACSSGQEPYSLSINHDEELKALNGYRGSLDIIATDLSETILNKAKKAEFDQLSVVRGLSEQRRDKYFDLLTSGHYKLKPHIQQKVKFRQLNLKDSYSSMGKFDIIFCRNVLIYFNSEFKIDILHRLSHCLKPRGFLFLGASESANGLCNDFEMVRCHPGIVYQLK